MRVLLLHHADQIPPDDRRWDLVIDLGRAPRSTYDAWNCGPGGRVLSLFDWANEIDDLYRTKELLELGLGRLLDRDGIDWWDVCSLMLSPDLQQFMLARRVARELDEHCDVHATRDSALVRGVQALLGVPIATHHQASPLDRLRSGMQSARTLDPRELFQILQDKFDGAHRIRWYLSRRPHCDGVPMVLCPSAYINVSRAVARQAASSPKKVFYLVLARGSARISSLPPNVRVASLDGYFKPSNRDELHTLVSQWEKVRERLVASSEEFLMADRAGVLRRLPSLLKWGVAVRDAWSTILDTENVVECFCADDSNPYTRIPLILAKKRRLPSVASHHGALDFRLAFKRSHGDIRLVKSEMERDYAVSICKVPARQIVLDLPETKPVIRTVPSTGDAPGCLTFFTEAYHSSGFREAEVFRELVPKLLSVTQALRLHLVFKLHPFDGVKKMRACLRTAVQDVDREHVHLWDGPMSNERWQATRVIVTGQSSVAVEAAEKGIRTFLCRWLGDPFSGYQKQFVHYGIGHLLNSAEEIVRIPELLRTSTAEEMAAEPLSYDIESMEGLEFDSVQTLRAGASR
jgi:hypothetical protein